MQEKSKKETEQCILHGVSCSSFDNSKIELMRKIRKQFNYGICDIKKALIASDYILEDAIKLLGKNKYRVS